jgi:hypothetical protein
MMTNKRLTGIILVGISVAYIYESFRLRLARSLRTIRDGLGIQQLTKISKIIKVLR